MRVSYEQIAWDTWLSWVENKRLQERHRHQKSITHTLLNTTAVEGDEVWMCVCVSVRERLVGTVALLSSEPASTFMSLHKKCDECQMRTPGPIRGCWLCSGPAGFQHLHFFNVLPVFTRLVFRRCSLSASMVPRASLLFLCFQQSPERAHVDGRCTVEM